MDNDGPDKDLDLKLSDTSSGSSGNRNVSVGADATRSKIITGDCNVVADELTFVINEAAAVGVTSLHQLPHPPRDFTGREEELDDLLSKLKTGGVTISGLQGQGGIGKTALALKMAEVIKPRYPDAQFYLDLKGTSPQPLTPADVMAHVIRAYNPAAQLPKSEAELRGIYQSVLHGQRALLLMDNAADRKQVEPLIPPATCVLLVTSRNHFHIPGLYAKDLEALSGKDSRELLLKVASRIGGEADEIARLCGYLPLALRLAAGTLAEREEIAPAGYVRRLKDARQRLKLLNEVEASLEVSYGLLSEEQQRQWRALVIFPDTFDVQAAAAIWGLDKDPAQDALSGLKARSLVEWDRDTNRYRLHDLARLFADSRLGEQERAVASRQHSAYFQKVLSAADELFLKGNEGVQEGLALYDQERLNIEKGQEWAQDQSLSDEDAARWCVSYALRGAYILNLRQYPREEIRWQEAALNAARRLNDRLSEGRLLGNLGLAYSKLGDVRKAIENQEQALVILRENGDRRGEGKALGNLGSAYRDLGDMHKAIEYYEQRILIAREVGDKRGEGLVLSRFGIAYCILGNVAKAIDYYEQALAIHREIGDRRGEADVLGNLGNAHGKLGDARKAIVYLEHQLNITREIGDKRGEGNALWNMGLALDILGRRAEAISHAQEAVKILEQIEDPNADKVRKKLEVWSIG